MRNFAPDDAGVSAALAASVRAAFEEDKAIVETVQRGLAAGGPATIDLKIDKGPALFRRRLARLIAAE
jgi:hypothetical protein